MKVERAARERVCACVCVCVCLVVLWGEGENKFRGQRGGRGLERKGFVVVFKKWYCTIVLLFFLRDDTIFVHLFAVVVFSVKLNEQSRQKFLSIASGKDLSPSPSPSLSVSLPPFFSVLFGSWKSFSISPVEFISCLDKITSWRLIDQAVIAFRI